MTNRHNYCPCVFVVAVAFFYIFCFLYCCCWGYTLSFDAKEMMMPVCVQIIHFIHTTVRTCTCFSPEPRREELLHHLSTTDTVFPTAVAKSVVLATGPGVPLWHFPGQRTDSFFTRRCLVFLCCALPFRSRMPSYTHRGSTHSITVLPGEEKCCNLFENLAFLSVSLKMKC